MNDIIEVRKLEKSFGGTKAVDNISFNIERGMLVSILGPNGAGKTTSLECMEGIIKPGSGEILLNGTDVATANKDAGCRIGIQLQSSALPGHLTVCEAMRLFCAYRKTPYRGDLLTRLGLDEKIDSRYHSLSTGQQRRLSLALSIIHDPEVLFLDEPTSGLDVQSRIELHRIIGELKKEGTTIILATHDMAEAETLSDKIIILLNGRIAAEGSPAEITSTGSSLSKISIRSEMQVIMDSAGSIPGIETFHKDGDYSVLVSNDIGKSISEILERLKTGGDSLIDLRIERPSLEERFVEIAGVLS